MVDGGETSGNHGKPLRVMSVAGFLCAATGLQEQERQEATMIMSLLAPDAVREQPETKPSLPSFVSTHWVVAAGALQRTQSSLPTMPTRCSTLGSAVNVSNNHAELVFLTTGTTHLPATP